MKEHQMKLVREGKADQLIGEFEEKTKTSPNDNNLKRDLGFIYCQVRRYKDAIRLYEELLLIDPNDYMSLTSLGIIYHWINESEKGLEIYKRVIKMSRDRQMQPEILSLAYTNIGVIYESMTHFERSVVAYKKALSIYPANKLAIKYLAELQEYGDTDYGYLRVRVLPDGTKRTELWYYHDIDISQINVDEFLEI